MQSIESRFVIGPSKYCLQACTWALFSLSVLQAGAVKGLKVLTAALLNAVIILVVTMQR